MTAVRKLHRLAGHLDPTPALAGLLVRRRPLPSGRLVSVYRRRNTARVLRLAQEAEILGFPVALWGLDGVAPQLERWTLGHGPGGRFALLNRLCESLPAAAFTIVTDDDVAFVRGGLRELVLVGEACDLDLFAPTHAAHSFANHRITRARPLLMARSTTFVEIGPMIVVGPRQAGVLLPFDEVGMGWGTELAWFDLLTSGLRLGLVDAVTTRHLDPVGGSYGTDRENERVAVMLAARGFATWPEMQSNLGTFGLTRLLRQPS